MSAVGRMGKQGIQCCQRFTVSLVILVRLSGLQVKIEHHVQYGIFGIFVLCRPGISAIGQ